MTEVQVIVTGPEEAYDDPGTADDELVVFHDEAVGPVLGRLVERPEPGRGGGPGMRTSARAQLRTGGRETGMPAATRRRRMPWPARWRAACPTGRREPSTPTGWPSAA